MQSNRPKPSSAGPSPKPVISSSTPKANIRTTSDTFSASVTSGQVSGAVSTPLSRGVVSTTSARGAGSETKSKTSTTGKEPVHLPLYRRLLFPYQSIEEDVPGLIKGQGELVGVINERLNHLIALALRGYINTWYTRFTRDKSLIPTIHTQILTPILSPILTSVYENPERLLNFLVVEIPVIVGLHLEVYWDARDILVLSQGKNWDEEKSGDGGFGSDDTFGIVSAGRVGATENGDGGASRALGKGYHARLPLLGVSLQPPLSIQTQDPTSNDPDSSHPKQSIPDSRPSPNPSPSPSPNPPISRQYQQGIYTLSPLYLTALTDSLLRLHLPPEDYASPSERYMIREILARNVLAGIGRKIGEGWFWYQLALRLMGEPGQPRPIDSKSKPPPDLKGDKSHGHEAQEGGYFEMMLHFLTRFWTLLSIIWAGLSSLVAIYSAAPVDTSDTYKRCWEPWFLLFKSTVGADRRRRWDTRIFFGTIEILLVVFGRWIDRIVPHLVRTTLLTPQMSLKLIDLVEKILFPDGYPAPSPDDPTPSEVEDLRRRFENRLIEVIPPRIRKLLTLDDVKAISEMIDPISDSGCNAHLISLLLDGIVAALIPQLVVSEVQLHQHPEEQDVEENAVGDIDGLQDLVVEDNRGNQ